MPYDERTVKELENSAEITPMGIQLEVNAEVFTVIYNLLSSTQKPSDELHHDKQHLYRLWRITNREMARVEQRRGWGIPMDRQIDMLREAFAIESRHMPDQVFRPIQGIKLTRKLIKKESRFDPEDMRALFEKKVWPAVSEHKTGHLGRPTAYIVAGQPGSGKTRMSSTIIEQYDGDIIQSMDDNFRGFHPNYKKLMRRYGQYCAYFTLPLARYLSDLTAEKAAGEGYNLIIEGAMEDIERTLSTISLLKEKGYQVVVMLRACPKKESWKAIHQLYLQQKLKAPGLSRLITKEHHDASCRSFLSAVNDIMHQDKMDQLIIKSPKGLLYDSDDMPTERVSDVLSRRMVQ